MFKSEVGLDLLHRNGTAMRDSNGDIIPTYGMEHIVNFAKVSLWSLRMRCAFSYQARPT